MTHPKEIQTARLILSRSTVGRLSALLTGPSEYQRVFGYKVEDGSIEYPEVLEQSLHQAREYAGHQHWWLPFLMIDPGHEAVVGLCGYKGPPDDRGFVEIGYGIAPAYRGRGLVSEAASALTRQALASPEVAGVLAHTLPEQGASARILTKCGFTYAGDFEDPDEGRLWRWELVKPRPE